MKDSKRLSIILSTELNHRMHKNPSYSLRAFANFLETDASALSKIVKGNRIPSEKTTVSFLKKLHFSDCEIAKVVECEKVEERVKRFRVSSVNEKSNHILEQSLFEIIANPMHYTFLELLKVNNSLDIDWFKSQMQITRKDTLNLIKRLEACNMIEIRDDRIYDISNGDSSHDLDFLKTSTANTLYQVDLAKLSLSSLKTVSFKKRDHSTIVMATSQKKIIEAKKIIKRFRLSLCRYLEDSKEKDSVYALHIGYFPLVETNKC